MIATFFPDFPVLLAQFPKGSKLLCVSRCYFCQNLAPFHTLSFSRRLIHFAADFVTLSYTKMTIVSLPFSILRARKRHPFRAEPPPIAHYREYSPPPGGAKFVNAAAPDMASSFLRQKKRAIR